MDPMNTPSFDQIMRTPQIDMLNAALPFVSDKMRKLLALYIKSAEIQRIYHDFDNEELLTACGFESAPPDPETMLKAMKLAGGHNASPQIDQILQIINMLKTYQKWNEFSKNNPELLSMLTNMMNQKSQNGSDSSKGSMQKEQKSPNNLHAQNNSPFTADLLKQFGNTNSSELMSILSQLL